MLSAVTSKVKYSSISVICYLKYHEYVKISILIFSMIYICRQNLHTLSYHLVNYVTKYGDQVLTSFEECEIAAVKLNINSPTSEDTSFYPKGCYIFGSSGSSVYFNLHSAGNAHGSVRPICKQSGEF